MKTASFASAIVALVVTAHAANAQTTHTVNLTAGNTFDPANITIDAGDTVRWLWKGGFHNVESGVGNVHNGSFRSGEPTLVDGTEFEVTFDQAFLSANPMPGNVYDYYCVVHDDFGMNGNVTVNTGPAGPGDGDGDGDIDLDDFESYVDCTTGPQAAGGTVTHDVTVTAPTNFIPDEIVIGVGDTVRWTWQEGMHNVESGEANGVHDGNFRSGNPIIQPGATFTHTFDQAFLNSNPMPNNLYPYFCAVHVDFGMTGSVTVQEGDPCGTFDFDDDGDVDFHDFGQFQLAFQP